MDRAEAKMLVLGRPDVENVVGFRDMIEAMEEAQRAWGNGHAVSNPMTGVPVPPEVSSEKHGNFMSYAAYIGPKSLNVAGMSWIACCIHNPTEFGLPYATGVQVVNDTVTGVPLAVMERSRLTEMATAGMSAVGAKYLANKDSTAVGIIGCGGQGRTHLQALGQLFDIKTARAFDVRKEALEGFAEEMSNTMGVEVQPAASPEEAVRGADIVSVSISPVEPVVRGEWLKPGAFVIAMCGGGGELYECVYRTVDKIVVDDASYNYRSHFEKLKAKGIVEGERYPELGKIVVGKQTGRERRDERILFMHSGMAVNHVAAGHLIYRNATEKGVGTEVRIL